MMPDPNRLRLTDVARALGIYPSTVHRATQRGWLDKHGATWRWSSLRRFVQDPRCWLIVPPARIADPALRAYALATRTGGARWWTVTEIAAYHHVTDATVSGWKRNGWPTPDAWIGWHSRRCLWCVTPPEPPEPLHSAGNQAKPRNQAYAVRRRSIARAVIAAGGPPSIGNGNGWKPERWQIIGDQFGVSGKQARRLWQEARRRGEVAQK